MSNDNYTPDFDDGYGLQDDQEEAYVIHTIRDIDSIINELGIDIVMSNLSDYSKEQVVRWLAKKY